MEKRNQTLRLSAEVRLFLGARRIADGKKRIACDRMVVLIQDSLIGNEDDVVIYKRGGKR